MNIIYESDIENAISILKHRGKTLIELVDKLNFILYSPTDTITMIIWNDHTKTILLNNAKR